MGLIKLLILVAVVWLVLKFWRRAQIGNRRAGGASARDQATAAPVMVRCARCQVHLPQSRALRTDDAWYCCAEHRDAKSD